MSRGRTKPSGEWVARWWRDGILRLALITLVASVAVALLMIFFFGRGPVLAPLSWVQPAALSFTALTSLAVAFFCLGRYRVLGENSTLWIGLAFWSFAIASALYLLGIADLMEGGLGLGLHPTAVDYFFHIRWSVFALLLLIAVFGNSGKEERPGWRKAVLLFLVVGVLTVAVDALLLIIAPYLPPLIAEGRFTALNLQWTALLSIIFMAGAVAALRLYVAERLVVVGLVAIVQLIFAFRLGDDIFGGQLYDAAWYFNRIIVTGSLSVLLLALLGEHVGLLVRERDLYSLAQRRAAELMAVLESMADAVFVLDRQANVVEVNRRGVELLGFKSRIDALRPLREYQRFVRATHLDGRPLRPEEFTGAMALRGETVRGFLEQAWTWDGRELILELSGAPIRDESGEIAGAVVVMHDVTEQERVRARAALARTATAVAAELDMERTLDIILEEAKSALNAELVLLFAVNEEERKLVLLAHLGLPADIVPALRESPLESPLVSARAALTRETQVVEDMSTMPPKLAVAGELVERLGVRSMAAVPLVAKDHLIGVLTFFTFEQRHFSPMELETMRTLADLFAVGLDNAQLFRDVRTERARLQAVIENSPAGIFVAEAPSGAVVMASKAAVEMLGKNLPRGTPIDLEAVAYGLFRPDGSPYAPDDLPLSEALRGETVTGQEVVIRRPDGSTVNVQVNAAPLRIDHRVEGAVAVFQDITALKGAQRRIEELADESERRADELDAIIDSMAEAVVVVDHAGRIARVNREAEKMWQRPRAQVLGVSITDLAKMADVRYPDDTPLPPEESSLFRALRGESFSDMEIVNVLPDGRRVYILVAGSPVRDESGRVILGVNVMRDITQIRELERQREEFISVVAHDLKGALTIMRGYSDMLLRPELRKTLPAGAERALEAIAGGARRLDRMIEDLLDVSRIEARRLTLEKQPLDLAALVREVVGRTGELTKGHVVNVEVAAVIPRVEADPVRMEQILVNLLSNAGKYSYPNTPIMVRVEPGPGEALVSVTNEGPGIDPGDVPRLFTRFHRTEAARHEKVPGLGLGLYITKGLVESHGGRIWVESEPKRTTTFKFTLPAMVEGQRG